MRISIREVTSDLVQLKKMIAIDVVDYDDNDDDSDDGAGWIDVRLQVHDDGSYSIHTGDSSYDTDHRGSWGASSICKRTNCRELAKELIDQAMEQYHCGKG